jgi:hypothetical protein
VELYLNFPNTPPWRGSHLKKTDYFTLLYFYFTFYFNLLRLRFEKILQYARKQYQRREKVSGICFGGGHRKEFATPV